MPATLCPVTGIGGEAGGIRGLCLGCHRPAYLSWKSPQAPVGPKRSRASQTLDADQSLRVRYAGRIDSMLHFSLRTTVFWERRMDAHR